MSKVSDAFAALGVVIELGAEIKKARTELSPGGSDVTTLETVAIAARLGGAYIESEGAVPGIALKDLRQVFENQGWTVYD